uniref:NADH-ubiquinone oxidoreductase chain 2 n=1 Tax=Theromyzon tessulatum TaxID=13286 RepID=A0A7L7S6B2_THETS|nr:NADH dehydrogenase subunit 2 [Theromyzon tessulatum]
MLKSLSPMMFLALIMMIMGTFLALSGSNWFSIWLGLEINMFSFIPFMSKSTTAKNCEAAAKYLLIQVAASMIMLYSGYIVISMYSQNLVYYWFLTFAFLMKLGAFPAHYWFPSIMQSCDWLGSMMLATWQKIAPAMILLMNTYTNQNMLMVVVIINTYLGGILGSNQTDIKTILAYSSVAHMGWFLMPLMYDMPYQSMYYLIMYITMSAPIFLMMQVYTYNNPNTNNNIMSLNNNMKFSLMLMILSLGGLPPLSGFIPKLMIMYNSALMYPLLTIILTIITCISLYFYLTLSFNLMLSNKKMM